ncbi:hypothetical protein [Pseudomonas fontis]|uniref:Fe2OG dioxygenase domain-containing protein n=1 Tax=Pseudomonas fontis TaxID=2942633 RepID=A0ABT5NLV4_9PSED|nr:hypothetical protein [Pseudomonas fontis]MDD0975400.1 hypothetical protein [Pseudomonas fontis]MDD0989238.1 hypothetical protein [Pseudomonas fontis]
MQQQGQNHVLSKALTAYPSLDKYHPDLRSRLDVLKEMADYAEGIAPLSASDYSATSSWAQALNVITHYGHGVYSFPYLSEAFCRALMLELDCMSYSVNSDEPEEAQIPEVTFLTECRPLFDCLHSLWANAGVPLAKVLLAQDPSEIRTIQAAQYTPENTPRGHWHNDKDSDVTLVVALTATHTGGGTLVHTGPFSENIVVPQLPVGHGMFFNGKAHRHYGMAVTEGERNLLVHWSEVK